MAKQTIDLGPEGLAKLDQLRDDTPLEGDPMDEVLSHLDAAAKAGHYLVTITYLEAGSDQVRSQAVIHDYPLLSIDHAVRLLKMYGEQLRRMLWVAGKIITEEGHAESCLGIEPDDSDQRSHRAGEDTGLRGGPIESPPAPVEE